MTPEFAQAIVRMQGSIEGAKKGKSNPAFRSKYADLGACWDACRDALQANDLAVIQAVVHSPPGTVGIVTKLVYGKTGEDVSYIMHVPLKDPTNPQAMGSSITYGRRYALCSMIGICPEDDDGNAASKAPITSLKEVPTNTYAQWSTEFSKLTARDDMKNMYSRLKNSPVVSDDVKNPLLTEWAKKIKETK